MRVLTMEEIGFVSGGSGDCEEGNNYGGIKYPSHVGQDLISFYEGLVEATSYMIERVATAL